MFPIKRRLVFLGNGVWLKILLFSLTLFLIRLADGIISFWAPNQIQSYLGSSFWMGIIISFQSVVGFAADLIFPSMLKTTTARKMIFWGIITSALTSFFLASTVIKPFLAIFLVTMVLWGIYYELVGFATYQFMGSTVPSQMRAGGWGVVEIFTNLSYFLGPLIAAFFLSKSSVLTEGWILIFLVLGLIVFSFFNRNVEPEVQIDVSHINPWIEMKHWWTLSEHIWPIIIISLLLGFVDSTFWTTGAVWSEKLAAANSLGGLFLPLYQLPAVFLGVVIAGLGIYKGKKILSEKVLIIAGIFLIGLAVNASVAWQLIMVFLSSTAIAVCYPLVEGIYTDVVSRMGGEKKEMIGLASSITNIAYVVWPPVAGLLASKFGERMTFSILGVFVVIVAFILLFVTPKKLRLPQEEIKTWEKDN